MTRPRLRETIWERLGETSTTSTPSRVLLKGIAPACQ
jgi:hypothetical protein